MVKVKKSSPTDGKKKGFSKNSSYSGVESKRSPKNRRKSIAGFTLNTETENTNVSPKKSRKSITKRPKAAKHHVPLVLAPKPEAPLVLPVKTPVKKKSHSDKNQVSKSQVLNIDFSGFEEKFNIKSSDIINAIDGIKKYASESPKFAKQLFNEQLPFMLQVNSVKVPKGHKRVLRIPLKNLPLTKDDDICLIVPEVKGIPSKEHERHVEHYEKLLADKNVTGIKKIMTLHEFRTEYETFELKSRLVDLYDAFLVDGKISGKVVQKSGKIFYNKRKLPTPIKLQVTKLKEHIETALHKVYFDLHLKSNSYIVQFGHSNMSIKELVENVYSVADFLNKNFPGGLDNVKNMYVTSPKTVAVPVYISLKNPNEVPVPIIKAKKPKAYKTYKGELTTWPAAKVTVKPSGEVIVKKKKWTPINRTPNSENGQEITDAEILKANEEPPSRVKSEEKSLKKSRKRKQDIEKSNVKEEGIVKTKKIKKEKSVVVKEEKVQQDDVKQKFKKKNKPTKDSNMKKRHVKKDKVNKIVKKIKSKGKPN